MTSTDRRSTMTTPPDEPNLSTHEGSQTIKALRQTPVTTICGFCGIELGRYGRRASARYCSNRCKQLKYRDRQYDRQQAAGTYRRPGGRRPGAGRPPGPARRNTVVWIADGGVFVRKEGIITRVT